MAVNISRKRMSSVNQNVDLEENDDELEVSMSTPVKKKSIGSRLKDRDVSDSPLRNALAPVNIAGPSAQTAAANGSKAKISQTELSNLYSNVIKLSTENKITTKNSWQLSLIDYIEDVIASTVHSGDFNAASCTIDASVKIYSCRVDSIHSETYKVLSGLSRSKAPGAADSDHEEAGSDDDGEEGGEQNQQTRKQKTKQRSFTSTLEENVAALNLKKVESAFDVDPLFARVARLFDMGGVKGMLLANLPMDSDGTIIFDSSTPYFGRRVTTSYGAPAGSVSSALPLLHTAVHNIQLSEAQTQQAAHLTPPPSSHNSSFGSVPVSAASSPAPHDAVDRISVASHSPAASSSSAMQADFGFKDAEDARQLDHDHEGDDGWGGDDDNDGYGIGDEERGFDAGDQHSEGVNRSSTSEARSADGKADGPKQTFDEQFVFAFLENGKATHWKYHPKRATSKPVPFGSVSDPKKATKERKKRARFEIDFCLADSNDYKKLFAVPKNVKTTVARPAKNNNLLLAPLTSFEPEELMRLFLKPKMAVAEAQNEKSGSKRGQTDVEIEDDDMSIGGDDFVPMEAGDEDRGFGGGDEPMYGTSTHAQSGEAGAEEQNDVGELQVDSGMVEKPMMVQPPEVKYDTQIKVVDVRALKDKLWTNVEKKKEVRMSQLGEKQFAPNESLALRFICLLHLANEHNLVLEGSTGMDDIIVQHG